MFQEKNKTRKKQEKGVKRKIKGDEIGLCATSLSISMLLMLFVVIFNVLEPRKHTNDDLSREKQQVLALIHAIAIVV